MSGESTSGKRDWIHLTQGLRAKASVRGRPSGPAPTCPSPLALPLRREDRVHPVRVERLRTRDEVDVRERAVRGDVGDLLAQVPQVFTPGTRQELDRRQNADPLTRFVHEPTPGVSRDARGEGVGVVAPAIALVGDDDAALRAELRDSEPERRVSVRVHVRSQAADRSYTGRAAVSG